MTAATPFAALAALAAVIALVLLSRRALDLLPRRFGSLGPAGRNGPLALEQVVAIDARRRLVLVRCGARRAVLLTGGPQDLMVGWLDTPPGDPA